MATTPFVLVQRNDALYPHSQRVNEAPIRTVSGIFDGAAVAAYKGSAVALNDVAQIISIPAGAFVLAVTHQVTTVEGGTCTYDIGDGATVAGYVVAATSGNGNAATNLSSFNGTTTPTFGVGKYYPAADTIDVKLISGTAAAVVIKVSATYIQTTPSVA